MDLIMETLTRLCINFVRSLQSLTDTAHNHVIMNSQTYGIDLTTPLDQRSSQQSGISGTGILMMTLIVLFILMVLSIRHENARGRAAEQAALAALDANLPRDVDVIYGHQRDHLHRH